MSLAPSPRARLQRKSALLGKRLSSTVKDGLSDALDTVRRGGARRPELLLIPQDLRTADPSLFAELAAGTMGLAGATANIREQSPFRVTPPSKAWQAALLGFGWLSDLRAAQSADAQDLARQTVSQWIAEARTIGSLDWSPAIAARRLMSWLTNANLLVEGAPAESYGRFMASCDQHMEMLIALSAGATGMPRLLISMALVMGAMCMTDQDERLGPAVKALAAELDRQIQPSGLHVNRNPAVLVELMLDLLPLKQCFIARDIEPPAALLAAMRRITPLLRHMQLGDRGLARFHGMSATELDKLASVLSYDNGETAPVRSIELSAASRYFRLQRRGTILILDGGPPPPPEHSGEASASALSFEISSGGCLLVVNAGAPGPADQHWRIQSRGTAAHSTLVLNETASSRLTPDSKSGPEAPPILNGPTVVDARALEPGDGSIEVTGQHNGYQDRYGMVHTRIVTLGAQGDRLSGLDRIHQSQRLVASNVASRSYAIHFHLHPQVRVAVSDEPDTADLLLRNGENWRFSARGAKLSLEDSVFFANFSGPIRTVQIVLRGTASEDTQVRWLLERLAELPEPVIPPEGAS